MSVTAHPGAVRSAQTAASASSSETSFCPAMVPTSVQTVLLHRLGGVGGGEAVGVRPRRHCHPVEIGGSALAGYRFPSDVILLAVRWYLHFGCRTGMSRSCSRSVESRSTMSRCNLGPALHPSGRRAAGPCRHTARVRWFVDETYVKVAGVWRHVYRAVDEHGRVIDILVSARRDIAAARRFFVRMLAVQEDPEDVTTDRAPTFAAVIAELLPAAVHVTEQHLNNRMECDHGGLKARLQPMGGLKTFRSARTSEGIPSSRPAARPP